MYFYKITFSCTSLNKQLQVSLEDKGYNNGIISTIGFLKTYPRVVIVSLH